MKATLASCPVDGCTARRRTDQVLCVRHWRGTPQELRDTVWNARAYEERRAAVRAVLDWWRQQDGS